MTSLNAIFVTVFLLFDVFCVCYFLSRCSVFPFNPTKWEGIEGEEEEKEEKRGRVQMGVKRCTTFLCGQAGIYSVGAVASHLKGDKNELRRYLALFHEVSRDPNLFSGKIKNASSELLYGRAGFLWGALFINAHVGKETVPLTTTVPVVDAIISDGLSGKLPRSSPLMYSWHGTPYLGAAHGLAGILHTVMQFPLTETDEKHVKDALRFLLKTKFPSGNYPSSLGQDKDDKVHWCHGAPGVALTLCQAAKRFPDSPEFLLQALEAGDLVWTRGLLRRLGLCHGISGNAYVFLALHRVTGGKKHFHRARMFGGFLLHSWRSLIGRGEMSGGDRPFSLFEGAAGLAHLWIDLGDEPKKAFFPGYEVPDMEE